MGVQLTFGISLSDSKSDSFMQESLSFIDDIEKLFHTEEEAIKKFMSRSPKDRVEFDKRPYRKLTSYNMQSTMMREFISWIGLLGQLSEAKKLFQAMIPLAHESGLNDSFCSTVISSADYRFP